MTPGQGVLDFLATLGGPLALVGFIVFILSGLLKLAVERIPTVDSGDAAPLLQRIVTGVFVLAIVVTVLGFAAYIAPNVVQWIRISKLGTDTRKEFRTSFELYGEVGSPESMAFAPTDTTFAAYVPINEEFTAPRRSTMANTGKYSLNFIPNGNPVTKRTATPYASGVTVAVSAVILDVTFDVSSSDRLMVAYFFHSSSNPRPEHNCDSSLSLYVKRDDRDWAHFTAQCGQAMGEAIGWTEVRLSIPSEGAVTMRLGFVYTLQNSERADSNAKYLIDDLDVRASKNIPQAALDANPFGSRC